MELFELSVYLGGGSLALVLILVHWYRFWQS